MLPMHGSPPPKYLCYAPHAIHCSISADVGDVVTAIPLQLGGDEVQVDRLGQDDRLGGGGGGGGGDEIQVDRLGQDDRLGGRGAFRGEEMTWTSTRLDRMTEELRMAGVSRGTPSLMKGTLAPRYAEVRAVESA